jgi:hypothetical protein
VTSTRVFAACVIAVLAWAGFAFFPGHTWLQSDTQIYTPILDHLSDPTLLVNDPIAIYAHVTWTIYDEVSLALRKLSGLDWQAVMAAQQLVFRALGLLGCFLLALSMNQGKRAALLAAACFGLGAVVDGPAVLTIEYEPVPRSFAVMLLLLAMGLGAQNRWRLAMAAASLATLYHPTTTAPFWVSLSFAAWWDRPIRRPAAIGIGAAAVLLALSAWLGPGAREPQPWFGVIDDSLAKVQRLRGAYNWIELWPAEWLRHHLILFGVVLLAVRRLRDTLPRIVAHWVLTLAVCAVLSIPLQWLLLDKMKWILIPQFQPARAVLFLTALTVLLGVVCGWRALAAGRWAEGVAWMAAVYALPVNRLLVTDLWTARSAAVTAGLALAAAGAAALCLRRPGAVSSCALAAIMAAPFLLLPDFARLKNYAPLHSVHLDQLSAWAAVSTPRDSVFLFSDVHRRLEPGVFRVKARRALYVDWKGGGQVNIMPRLGMEWWRRWMAVGQCRFTLKPLARYRDLGIDYLVVQAGQRPQDAPAVFANQQWEVVALHP